MIHVFDTVCEKIDPRSHKAGHQVKLIGQASKKNFITLSITHFLV